ncbi:MAG: DNA repair protein RadA [Phycisphaerales bacterium]
MARTKSAGKSHFLCNECGAVQPRWMGKCPDCGAWDALKKFVEPAGEAAQSESIAREWQADEPGGLAPTTSRAIPLVEVQTRDTPRWPSGIGELDRVLGGGFVPGSVTLLGGEPGIGKSTLLMQAAARLAGEGRRVLYATSEESAEQVRMRAERLLGGELSTSASAADAGGADGDPAAGGGAGSGLDRFYVLADTNLARIAEQAREVRPDVCVIDSIQMVWKPDLDASPGSASQLRHCASELVRLAKVSSMAVIMVGHVTKDGQLAGPKLLEHLVDTVVSFEGDAHHAHRIVRGVKNRFGTTLEVGLFEMTGTGLQEVRDIGRFRDDGPPRPGAAVAAVMHGTRAIPVEIQALTATGILGGAKRKASGIDTNRLAMIIAVLEQHGGMRLADQDIFVQVVGGLRVVEPAADLAVMLAIASAMRRQIVPRGLVAAGEVGLGGEIRGVQHAPRRAIESARLGYRGMLSRPAGSPSSGRRGREATEELPIPLVPARTVAEVLSILEPLPVDSRG